MMKQIIILRKDLNMRKGKMVAQGAHAAMAATLEHLYDERVIEWLCGPFTKICVSVDSYDELMALYALALCDGMVCSLILDAGRTEFNGVPTYTAVAIGPDTDENLRPLTGHLKLL